MKEAVYGYRADIIGLLWLALALFLSLALGSYYPMDSSFNSLSTLSHVQNKCGFLGSFLSDILYQLFGLGAWVFVILSLRQSFLVFQRKVFKGDFLNNTCLLAFGVFVCSSLLELHQPGKSFFEGNIYPGGVLGHIVINKSQPYLHTAGHVLIFWSLALVLFLLVTKSSLTHLLLKALSLVKIKTLGSSLFIRLRNTFIKPHKKLSINPLSIFDKKDKLGNEESKSSILSFIRKASDKTGFFSSISEEKNYFFHEEKKEADKKEETNSPSVPAILNNFSSSVEQWMIPKTHLLHTPPASQLNGLSIHESEEDALRLQRKLEQFSISGEIINIRSGPVITLFEFKPDDHIKVARITQMEDDLMIALKSKSIRIIAPIPGRDVVGIETAHTKRQMVHLKTLIDEPDFKPQPLPLILGRHVDGRSAIRDLRKIPHLMVAGSTGSGKSVFVVSFLLSLLFRHTPQSLRLLLVDPKRVDLSVFSGLPHLLAPPAHESSEAVIALKWCLNEMQKRYRSLARFHVRDMEGFNEKTKNLNPEEIKKHNETQESLKDNTEEEYYFTPQPYICIVLEEFGDLMSSPDRSRIETSVVRLAQMARACGMHLILSMQSPRKDVVTGLIKTNIPGRISFKVSSRIDSRIILDEGGAERLLSQGDMLYLGPGQARPERYHGPFVKEEEVLSVVNFWKKQAGPPDYLFKFSAENKNFLRMEEEAMDAEDQKYEEIFSYVSELKEISASHLQRKYGLGYPRAARLIDRLEEEGIVGPARGSKAREVLIQNS